MLLMVGTTWLLVISIFHQCYGQSTTTSTSLSYADFVTLIVIMFSAIIGGTMVGLTTYFYFASKVQFSKYNTPNLDLLAILKEDDNTLTEKTLRDKAKTVLSLVPMEVYQGMVNQHDQAKVDAFLATIADKARETAEQSRGEIEIIKGARDAGTLPIRTASRVQPTGVTSNLHISKMKDFYNNPMLLTAAPMSAQFAHHWQIIWQEKIGVIVWIGRLAFGKKKRMDAYIQTTADNKAKYGSFTVTTEKVVEKYNHYTIYYLNVQNDSGGSRKISIIHAYEWLQDSVTWALKRDVELVVYLGEEHIKHILVDLPGVMIQCKLGTAGSATLLACYIGYQTWQRFQKVNINGILRYIRFHRVMAFEMTGDPAHKFLLQVQITYAVMTGIVKLLNTGKYPDFEPWIKDIWTNERPSMALDV